ncbi:MAG: hypothetical protein KIH09_06095, partial [Candidatus Freyarchaeota archaeon]|nr:hypothetical protein [Candidatus Jordarchaeia archaeon]
MGTNVPQKRGVRLRKEALLWLLSAKGGINGRTKPYAEENTKPQSEEAIQRLALKTFCAQLKNWKENATTT